MQHYSSDFHMSTSQHQLMISCNAVMLCSHCAIQGIAYVMYGIPSDSIIALSIELPPRLSLMLLNPAGNNLSAFGATDRNVLLNSYPDSWQSTSISLLYIPSPTVLAQDVNNLPTTGEKVSPLKVKRSAKGNVPWLMATTYMTSAGGPQEGRRFGGSANSRFQMAQQEELTREKQLQDIEVIFSAWVGVCCYVWGGSVVIDDVDAMRCRFEAIMQDH